jgi:crossover junction endodeoxyribonuclease RuvC
VKVLGCDPGKKGAIALIDGAQLLAVFDMPVVALKRGTKVCCHSLNDQLAALFFEHGPIDLAVLETVHATPQMGVTSAFDFGRSSGVVEMALVARGVRLEQVQPAAWKKALGLDADKNSSLALARAKWPGSDAFSLQKHEGRAESSLIAEWARRFMG